MVRILAETNATVETDVDPRASTGPRRRDLAVASEPIMASVSSCRSLALILVVVVAISVTGAAAGSSKAFRITNSCSYTVWPGISSGAGSAPALHGTGFELAPGESRAMTVASGWSGRVWGRTLCSTDAGTGKFTCVTGDCGSGKMDCAGGYAAPPVTLAQFTLDGSGRLMDSYDVSLVEGFNLPMLVEPQGGAAAGSNYACAPTGCVTDLNTACPAELRVTSGTGAAVACKSACLAFGSPQYCCTGEYGTPDTCKPSAYSQFFKHACSRAYSYAYDGAGSTLFACAGGDTYYSISITFCPSTTRGKTVTNPRSEAPGNGNLPHINGGSTTPYTAGGTTPNTGSVSPPWRIALLVAILGAVAAALGALAQFFGLFKELKQLCCNQPIQGAGGAVGPFELKQLRRCNQPVQGERGCIHTVPSKP